MPFLFSATRRAIVAVAKLLPRCVHPFADEAQKQVLGKPMNAIVDMRLVVRDAKSRWGGLQTRPARRAVLRHGPSHRQPARKHEQQHAVGEAIK